MNKFMYEGKNFDFYYTFNDLDTVEKYDNAEKKMNAILTAEEKNNNMKERIVNCCVAMADFIDEVLGDGTVKSVFGDKANNTDIIMFKNTLVSYVAGRMQKENTAKR